MAAGVLVAGVLTGPSLASPASASTTTTPTTVPLLGPILNPTTTTVPPTTTTTTLPPTTVPPTTVAPKKHPPKTTTTTSPSPTTTVSKPHLKKGKPPVPTGGAKSSVAPNAPPPNPLPVEGATGADIDRLDAIDSYLRLRHVEVHDRSVVATATARLDGTERDAAVDTADRHRAATSAAQAGDGLAEVAIAAYTGAGYVAPAGDQGTSGAAPASVDNSLGAASEETADADEMFTLVVQHEEQRTADAKATLDQAEHTEAKAEARVKATGRVVTDDRGTLAAAQDRRADAETTAEDTDPGRDPSLGSPDILSTTLVTASELAGWFATTGEHANVTVPMRQLAADYVLAGKATGVRADVAFAQSIVETGYFSFPSGGQLTSSDNNFAGIGACDSCAHGWSFPDALTGVTAQEELLSSYATTDPRSTALVGQVGIGGCCQTWMSLSGTWATNAAYGIEILEVYDEILNWVIPRRLDQAGLTASS